MENMCLILHDVNPYLYTIFGGFWYYIGVRVHLDIMWNVTFILVLSSQALYYYNYRNGIKPTFLRVFQMMSGYISPNSVGLTNGTEIRALLKRSKRLLELTKLNNEIAIPILSADVMLFTYIMNCSQWETWLYGVPNTIYYVLIKIKFISKTLSDIQRRRYYGNVNNVMKSLDAIFDEIDEYNTTFWSKFICIFWFTIGSFTVIFLYILQTMIERLAEKKVGFSCWISYHCLAYYFLK
ncbi:unnamed protein product [Medioppia subpectinata]|uniref:Uncharacterized protein n=1 Tax=Medioppia subpectinata TaxID=1979941 RepID=A0A7R9KY42_9ACAR|nr:unnamed protein product [Medioppia subpectinata]CAG2111678.1 unnamed protein product [Medioppia subpectinata]